MMDVQHLNRVLDATFESDIGKAALTSTWRRRQAEGERPLVHVEAGARLFDICQGWTPLARVQQMAAARHKLFVRREEDRFYHCSLNGNRWLLSGHANGLTAMAADDEGLYGITRSNLFCAAIIWTPISIGLWMAARPAV